MKLIRTPNSVLAWCFVAADERLRHGDGREVRVGITHEVLGPPQLCWRGLHASEVIFNALTTAPGPVLYRVELSGEIVRGYDMLCATRRRYLARVDVTPELREFARACALNVIDKWEAPPVVEDYLRTGSEAVRKEAWGAAYSAAYNATDDAAEGAAMSAVFSAEEGVVFSAVESARHAAYATADSAVGSTKEGEMESLSRRAAWDAAFSAAWDMQARRLHDMIMAVPGHRVRIIG